MANKEHLKILKDGVKEWNRWREDNREIRPDLTRANLLGVNLENANLTGGNLYRADLSETYLRGANLAGATLSGADLSYACLNKANFTKAWLNRTKIVHADLRGANLDGADLEGSWLRGAKLKGAKIIELKLHGADLSEVNLEGADLGGADLDGANLRKAKLRKAKLYEADLYGANLTGANLSGANLSGANLRSAILYEADLSEANLEGANLLRSEFKFAKLHRVIFWGNACDGWNIEGVKCSHIFDSRDGGNRIPKDRDFEEGEFERLYASLPTFEYIFENGMNPLDPFFMNQIVEEIRKQKPEFELKVDSINAKGLYPSIKFSVKDEQYKKAAEATLKDTYETNTADVKWMKEQLSLAYSIIGDQAKALKSQAKALKKNPRSITVGDITQITGNVTSSSVGKNKGKQTWNITQPVKDSHKLDGEAKKWLMSIAEKIQADSIPDDEKPVVESKMNQLQTELEKDKPDKSVIQRAWGFLTTAAPTIKTLVEIPAKIAEYVD